VDELSRPLLPPSFAVNFQIGGQASTKTHNHIGFKTVLFQDRTCPKTVLSRLDLGQTEASEKREISSGATIAPETIEITAKFAGLILQALRFGIASFVTALARPVRYAECD
jgi:hypothetical protein